MIKNPLPGQSIWNRTPEIDFISRLPGNQEFTQELLTSFFVWPNKKRFEKFLWNYFPVFWFPVSDFLINCPRNGFLIISIKDQLKSYIIISLDVNLFLDPPMGRMTINQPSWTKCQIAKNLCQHLIQRSQFHFNSDFFLKSDQKWFSDLWLDQTSKSWEGQHLLNV